MSSTCREPKLRFKEFSGAWKDKKLGDITSLLKDGSHGSHKDYNSEYLLLSAKNIKNGQVVINKDERRISEDDYKAIYKNYILKDGDILLSIVGTIGRSAIFHNLKKVAFQRSVAFFRFDNMNSTFMFQLFNTEKFQNELDRRKVISAQPGIYLGDLSKITLSISQEQEQEKIASFLSSIDTKIEQITKKQTLLKEYKKGVMQKIFSQEIRFQDENGNDYPDWVEKKLGDCLIKFRLGGNYANTETVSNFPLIKMGNLSRGKINLKKLEYIKEGEKIENIDRIQYGDLFFNTRNTLDLVGKVAIWKNELAEAYYNSNLMYMKFDNNFFMNYRLNSFEGIKVLRRIATGTTSVAAIYTKDLIKIKFTIPSIKEQTKIANFLSSIDSKLLHVEKQLDSTKEFKKALLQQMFV